MGYVPGEQPADSDVVKLNTNENPYEPSPGVVAALGNFGAADLRLYPDSTCSELRTAIAAMHGCEVQQVFVGNGSDEILALCTRAFVENDGGIGYFDISYSLYPVLSEIRDVRKCAVALGANFEWVAPNVEDCRLFFLANPNAPTGLLYPEEAVRGFCGEFRGVVVIDEAYVDFASRDCMHLATSFPNVIVMRTLSKSYSLAGLRIGYAVGARELIDALYKIKDSYNVGVLSQKLALAAIMDVEHMRGNAARIKATRSRMTADLEGAGFMVFPSETNFLWVKPLRCSAEEVFEGLKRQRILVRYFPEAETGDHVRITVGTDKQADMLMDAISNL